MDAQCVAIRSTSSDRAGRKSGSECRLWLGQVKFKSWAGMAARTSSHSHVLTRAMTSARSLGKFGGGHGSEPHPGIQGVPGRFRGVARGTRGLWRARANKF